MGLCLCICAIIIGAFVSLGFDPRLKQKCTVVVEISSTKNGVDGFVGSRIILFKVFICNGDLFQGLYLVWHTECRFINLLW